MVRPKRITQTITDFEQNMRLKAILTIALLTSLFVLPIHAQIGEQRHNLSVGFSGGVNMNSVSFTPRVRQGSLWGINGGVVARYISERYFKMICGAQIELNFSQHGWSESYEDYPELQYTRKMNYLEIPFLAHLAFGRERGLQFFIHAGPQIGFFLGDSYTISDNWSNYSSLTVVQHTKAVENKFDYGIAGGGGLELRTKIGNFIVEGRYYYALSDFYGTTKRDDFSRAAHGTVTIKIGYLFDLSK